MNLHIEFENICLKSLKFIFLINIIIAIIYFMNRHRKKIKNF